MQFVTASLLLVIAPWVACALYLTWALKSCKDPSYLPSTVKFGVEVVSQNGSSQREAKRQSSLGPTHHLGLCHVYNNVCAAYGFIIHFTSP